MKLFVHTPEFKAMNVGFGLDEGIAGPGEVMPLFYGERNVFWIKVRLNSSNSFQLPFRLLVLEVQGMDPCSWKTLLERRLSI